MTSQVSPRRMRGIIMSMAPDDGPLRPVVLWQTHQGWKLTNNGGRDWWELADLDLPEWLLVPRVEEAMALPRSDIPSWVQTPRRFVGGLQRIVPNR